ncbi:unnamed protein product [Rhizopus stolonifer]
MTMLCEEPDAMEFEYTHPQTHFNTNSFLSSQPCFQKQSPFISAQLFSKSIFDTQETTNSVCSLLDTFNLSEKEEPKPELKTISKNNPPKSPPPITKEVSVEPTVPPTSVHHQHAYNHHTPTFIYNQAPIPTIDPLAERRSTLYYIMGLIKLDLPALLSHSYYTSFSNSFSLFVRTWLPKLSNMNQTNSTDRFFVNKSMKSTNVHTIPDYPHSQAYVKIWKIVCSVRFRRVNQECWQKH